MAAAAFPRGPSQAAQGSSARSHTPRGRVVIPPAQHPWLSPLPGSEPRQCCPYGACHLPRAPSPVPGATRIRVVSSTTSEGITPPSSLIQTHAPRHPPLADFGLDLYSESLQVAASPCWEVAVPDVISTVCAWVPGPIPRRGLPGAFARFFPGNIGLTSVMTRSARGAIPAVQLPQGNLSRLQSFRYVQAPMLARPPDCTYRCGSYLQGSRAVYTTQ